MNQLWTFWQGRRRTDPAIKMASSIVPTLAAAFILSLTPRAVAVPPPVEFSTATVTLRNDVVMPLLLLGTAGLANDREVLRWALESGAYRGVDTASDAAPWYRNERDIAAVVRALAPLPHALHRVPAALSAGRAGRAARARARGLGRARRAGRCVQLFLGHGLYDSDV